MKHYLKTWPEYFQAVWDGVKTFEVRKNDRDFNVGDVLVLQEFDPKTQEYSSRALCKRVTYILGKPFAKKGHVIMSLADVNKNKGLTLPISEARGFTATRGKLCKSFCRCVSCVDKKIFPTWILDQCPKVRV